MLVNFLPKPGTFLNLLIIWNKMSHLKSDILQHLKILKEGTSRKFVTESRVLACWRVTVSSPDVTGEIHLDHAWRAYGNKTTQTHKRLL